MVRQTVGLRPALVLWALYAISAGVLLLLSSPLARAVVPLYVPHPVFLSAWGTSLVVVGVAALATAWRLEGLRTLAWVFAVWAIALAGYILDGWLEGAVEAQTAIVPIVVNLLCGAWIWSVRQR